MFRIRNTRFKFFIFSIILCISFIYLIKFRYISNEHETKHIVLNQEYQVKNKIQLKNLSIQFALLNNISVKVYEAERDKDLNELFIQRSNLNSLNKKTKFFYKTTLDLRPNLKTSNEKFMILEYTNVFFKPKFCHKTSEQIFNSQIEKCEFKNCEYSCDKASYLNNADALLFHQRDLEAEFQYSYKEDFSEWLKSTKQIPFKTVEEKTRNNPNQIWILWDDEATEINPKFNRISNLFNWTLSFKTDSEIFEGSYGFFKLNNQLSISNLIEFKREAFLEHFMKRKDAILWFVSNCDSKLRSQVALNISKYYPLHIYGKCDFVEKMDENYVKKTYPYLEVFNLKVLNQKCDPGSVCEEEKFKSYKFYLAFENRNCTDYVTEKIWKSLNKQMIPIVLQPNRESYIRYSIPSKSFIHLQDFDYDTKKLTNHLKDVDSNFSLYNYYLKWTHVYLKTYYNSNFTEPHRMCQLCKELNMKKNSIYYTKIADFFNKQCKS